MWDTNDGSEGGVKTGNILESTGVVSVFYPRGTALSLGQLIVAPGFQREGADICRRPIPPPSVSFVCSLFPPPGFPFLLTHLHSAFVFILPPQTSHSPPSIIHSSSVFIVSLLLPFYPSHPFLSPPPCPIYLLLLSFSFLLWLFYFRLHIFNLNRKLQPWHFVLYRCWILFKVKTQDKSNTENVFQN